MIDLQAALEVQIWPIVIVTRSDAWTREFGCMVSKPFGVIRLADPFPVESIVFICAPDWSVIAFCAERTTDAALRTAPCSIVIVSVIERLLVFGFPGVGMYPMSIT